MSVFKANEDGLATPMSLPYFHGDLWPHIIEECIMGVEKEEEQEDEARRRQQQQEERDANANTNAEKSDDDQMPVEKQQESKKKKKKNLKNLKKSSQNNDNKKKGQAVVTRLFNHLKKQKDVFFTIRLFSPDKEEAMMLRKSEIVDPDPLITCELVDTRENFLAKSRKEHWEFGQLRRAKWTTLELCYMLHTQTQPVSLQP
jgi:E1A/CREB-binding protein